MPGQQMRRKNVRRKLNAMALEFQDKNVLIVDGQSAANLLRLACTLLIIHDACLDSIVRGTTSKEIIQMAKDVGAKSVIVASCAPPIRYSNVYGIDMPSRAELVAHDRDTSAIAQEIGCDLVIFQKLEDLVSSVRQFNPSIPQFDCSVFTGEYVTGGVSEAYLAGLEQLRADNVKGKTLVGGLGTLEGKGGGGINRNGKQGSGMDGVNANATSASVVNGSGSRNGNEGTGMHENGFGGQAQASGPIHGGDTVGLHNGWNLN